MVRLELKGLKEIREMKAQSVLLEQLGPQVQPGQMERLGLQAQPGQMERPEPRVQQEQTE